MITREELVDLKLKAQKLEPNNTIMKLHSDQVSSYIHNFYNNIYDTPAFINKKDLSKKLLDHPFTENGYGMDFTLNLFKEEVDESGLNPASGGHLGYIPGGGIFHSALADSLADVTNEYAGHFFVGPGAVRVENMFLRWLMELTGFPHDSVGNLTSGGSIANLIGIVCARDAKNINSDNIKKSVIYTSEHAHHCNHKAIRISGLNEAIFRNVKLDANRKIDAQELEYQIQQDLQDGLNPFLVIASAGTTDLGTIDPLEKIAEITKRFDCWLHIDAAYGGFFILTDEGKIKLKGIENADSLVVDPHKGMFLPYGLGAVLIKNQEALKKSHYYQANYLQDAFNAIEEISPADVSPELTKHFRGLRAWFPLMINGIQPFKDAAQEKLELCRYFYQEIGKISNIELGPEPELSVCAFRYIPKDIDANQFNLDLTEEIRKDGRVFHSSTTIEGKVFIRLACLSIRTHIETIELSLKVIQEKINELENRYEKA